VRRIIFNAKCNDQFSATIFERNGKSFEYDGYVPDIIPNSYGDYVELVIDLDTGKILNWKVPTDEEIEALRSKEEK